MKTFDHQKMKLRREELGLTQQQVSQRMGLRHRQMINRWEAGLNSMSTHNLCRLAAALDVEPAYFLK